MEDNVCLGCGEVFAGRFRAYYVAWAVPEPKMFECDFGNSSILLFDLNKRSKVRVHELYEAAQFISHSIYIDERVIFGMGNHNCFRGFVAFGQSALIISGFCRRLFAGCSSFPSHLAFFAHALECSADSLFVNQEILKGVLVQEEGQG